ncbi:pyridoxal phosphate-dependent aminotransferase [Micromonospora sp. NPDC000729]|uniref:pyridoxal phosphate-dependent aminotransferase n=1 Tax=Micromonospora sp. NPDC000729 TaxID=3364220 RepID=UPI00369A5066
MSNDVLVPKFAAFRSTIFAEMTALANRTGAINLGQGFPDSDGPPELLKAAADAVLAGRNQYPPLPGVPELRRAIAEQRSADYGTPYDPDTEILVTAGATEAITAAIAALVPAGDEVLVFEPYYDSYSAAITMAGAHRRTVPLRPQHDRFTFDPDELAAAVTPRTRAVLVNTPHNPTGTVFSAAELAHIAAVCRRHDLIAVTDEVYEHLTFDGIRHVPLASLPGMAERTLTISSAGKTFNATGWKIGWACGPERMVAAVRTVKQYLTFAGGTPFQYAVAAALPERHGWLSELRARLMTARDTLRDALTSSGWRCFSCEAGYFLQVDARSVGYLDGTALCQDLATKAGVVAIPSSAFYADTEAGRHLVRFAFCKSHAVIATAAGRLAEFAGTTKQREGAAPWREARRSV